MRQPTEIREILHRRRPSRPSDWPMAMSTTVDALVVDQPVPYYVPSDVVAELLRGQE